MKPITRKCSTCQGKGQLDWVPGKGGAGGDCNICDGRGNWLETEKCLVQVLSFIASRICPQALGDGKAVIYAIILLIRLLRFDASQDSPDDVYEGMEKL